MSDGIKKDITDLMVNSDDNGSVQPDVYLDPRRNSEMLQKLESIGVYVNIKGKKQIKSHRGKIKRGRQCRSTTR